MFCTGAFDRNLWEIDAWFLFLPGYRREELPAEGQGVEVFGDLLGVVVSFFCDAVSTVGNNLYKYLENVRCILSEIKGTGGLGNSKLLVSTKLVDILQVKLSESSPDDSIASLRLVLFWVHQIQLSCRVNPLGELEQLLQTCFICIKHILAKLLVVKSDFDTLTTTEALVLVSYIQEVAKTIFDHPAVILSLSRPLCCNKEPAYGSLCNSFEDFISSSKLSVHSMEHNILPLLTTVADYLLALSNDQCAFSQVHDAAIKQLLKVFKTMVQQVVSSFRDKFNLCIESKDMTPLLPTYNILHVLIHYISPFELLDLVQWMFRKVDRTDSIGWKSSKEDAFSIGCYIADGAFDFLSSYLHQVNGKTVSSSLLWEFKGGNFDVALLEEVYYKVIELATSFKLECADLCLLKAANIVYRHKHLQPQTDVLPAIMAMSRVILSSPIKILSHCIQKTSATKAKFLFLLTEVSPLHLTLFGQIFLSITGKHLPSKSNMVEENCNCALSDEELMMLLPVALSYLNLSITKFGLQYLKYLGAIPSIYSKILLDGFLNWKSFVSGNIFQEEHDESVPLSTQDLLNIFSNSLLGKAIHMLRYYFALNVDSMGKKKRKELFGSIYPFSGANDELLDCDVSELNICSTNHSLNIIIRVIAKISFSRLLLFPEDNFIESLKTETGEDLKEMPLRIGSNRKDTLKLRFMSILVTTLHKIVERFPLVADTSRKSESPDCSQLFRFLEAFILRNIVELSRAMKTELVQLDSLPFLEPFFKSSLIYRFEDPTTLKVLRGVLVSLSEGKYSSRVFFELLQAHSQFVPSILWSDSISDSSSASNGGTLLRPISSILKSHVLLSTDLRAADDKISLEISPSYSRKLEVIKLFRVLYHLKVYQKNNIAPEEDISMNSGELLSLLLSCYGATMSEVDLEIFNLMHEIVSIEGSDCLGIAEMVYLWGGAALKLRREKELESSNDMTDAIFVAEASLVLLDPSHDHYFTMTKLLTHTPKVDLEIIPLFHTSFESSSINFKTDRLWILHLSYAGLNLDDDALIFRRKCLSKMLSFYSSSLSDYESKALILQIVKKSVKLPTEAQYLVEHRGLISWAELVLRAMLMSAPPIIKIHMDRAKLIKFVMLAIPVASLSYSEETFMLKKYDIQFATFLGEQPCKETLISKLLRWVTASVILGRISKKSCKMNSSSESVEVENLQLLLENLNKEQSDSEGQEDDWSNDVALAATILHLQQLLGMNCKVLQSVVSALCLLLLSDNSYNSGGAVSLIGDQGRHVASLCSKIRCPVEANPTWRWSFDQPWKDSSSELTDLQKVDEYHACQTLLLVFSNALRGKSLDLPVLSHRDLEDSGVFAWERNILTTELCFK
ncbi:hypothetical protein BVC80_91g1 [Macleaya cordata]|uniref:URB1 C-terminal domain-containing protein n=1 Tax=Macleaya cordata TaxID=56857 RepID=A0A200Q6G7_MACCD|nr:hypothetical protein BVC80_91g1 [Macleaya cordata]